MFLAYAIHISNVRLRTYRFNGIYPGMEIDAFAYFLESCKFKVWMIDTNSFHSGLYIYHLISKNVNVAHFFKCHQIVS